MDADSIGPDCHSLYGGGVMALGPVHMSDVRARSEEIGDEQ